MPELPVRLTLTVEIEVPLDTTIDLDEFRQWRGSHPWTYGQDVEPTNDKVLEFVNSFRDMTEIIAQFPIADPRIHPVVDSEITDAEILQEQP